MAQIREPDAPLALSPRGFALFALGFRPFYLVASVFASVSVFLWIGDYAGLLPSIYGRDPVWHAHEMIYGYTIAVIVGFLFTAGRNWTNQPTPQGPLLVSFVVLWLAGRLVVLTPWITAAAVVNAAFPITAGMALAVPFLRSRNSRNYFFVGLLFLIGVADFVVHLAHAGTVAWPARAGLLAGLDIVLFIMAVMGGRVIPMFTNNAIRGADSVRKPLLEKLALGSLVALFAADALQLPALVVATITAVAALSHASRLALWKPWRTRGVPLVWILHAGYGWIVIHLALRALVELQWVPGSVAVHALTVGAIGSLTIGMMTRTAKGHTGRPLVASKAEVVCYGLVEAAAVVRVFGAMLMPSQYVGIVVVSGLFWAAAFGLYAVLYWSVLSRPRLDGKPG
jgi:uncharacterized protein involved in response to NO